MTSRLNGSSELHQYCLDRLLQHLNLIDENPYDVAWVMHEGIYMPKGTTRRNSLCDLVIAKYDNTITLAELKSNKTKRKKAKNQLYAGRRFVVDQLPHYEVGTMKYVWYTGNEKKPYDFEIIE